jgi:type I restriction enzyme, S subunit
MVDLKPYPEARTITLPWLQTVPPYWDVRRIKTLLREHDRRTKTGEERLLSLRMREGIVDHLESGGKPVRPTDLIGYKIVEPGVLIMNRMRASSGLFGVASIGGLVSPDYATFRPTSSANTSYLLYLFKTPMLAQVFRGESRGLGTGEAGFLRLYTGRFGAIEIPVPPIEEQQLIVRFLDTHGALTARLIRAKQRLIKLLEEQKQAIIHRAVTRGLDPNVRLKPSGVPWLGHVPEHWEVRRLKWVTRLQRGYDLPAERRVVGPYPVVSSGGIIGTHIEARAATPGVVIGRYGSTDAVYFVDQDFWPHNTSLFVTDFQGNDERWCYYLLRTISKGDHAGKSAVPGVDRKDLFDIRVPAPPVDEQRAVVGYLEVAALELDRSAAAIEREITLLREFRTRLVADVVTGKIDVRAAAAALPEITESEPINEPSDGEDLEEALDDVENEEVAA